MSEKPTAYELLGVSATASVGEIRAARNRLVKELSSHTADPEEKEWREERFKEVNTAYERLADPESRRRYDEDLAPDPGNATSYGVPGHAHRPSSAETADPSEHRTEPPLLLALASLLWRLLKAGARQLPWVFRNGPRVVLVGGGLLLAVVISSWVFRSCSNFNDAVRFEGSLPDRLTRNCDSGFGFSGHVPEGSSASLDCTVKGVRVKYFDTDDGNADRYFAQHLREAERQEEIRRGSAGSCARPGHVTAYRYRGDFGASGRVFCWINGRGQVRFEWTDSGIYAQAVSGRAYAAVYRWWRKQGGPRGDNRDVRAQPKVR